MALINIHFNILNYLWKVFCHAEEPSWFWIQYTEGHIYKGVKNNGGEAVCVYVCVCVAMSFYPHSQAMWQNNFLSAWYNEANIIFTDISLVTITALP